MGTQEGEGNPSVARRLSDLECAQLREIALALPTDWVVQILPPHGQLAICPAWQRRIHHRCWTASVRTMTIFREDGRARP
jgi:hypothetical protein